MRSDVQSFQIEELSPYSGTMEFKNSDENPFTENCPSRWFITLNGELPIKSETTAPIKNMRIPTATARLTIDPANTTATNDTIAAIISVRRRLRRRQSRS